MKNNNVKKNTATKNEVKTEKAVKPETAVNPQNASTFPVFPAKLRSKTEEFCNEFETIQLLKKRKMSANGNVHKALIDKEIKARKQLIGAFQTQLEFLIDDACDKVTQELA